jgi:GTP cyclohydrolase I
MAWYVYTYEHHVEPVLILSLAKSTVSRLHETTAERNAREKMMVSAVRTILECIGEDPNREGLLKTPERYAQAIMWMTRGYEERLAGKAQLSIDTYKNIALSESHFRFF